jgi:hypothetical protein
MKKKKRDARWNREFELNALKGVIQQAEDIVIQQAKSWRSVGPQYKAGALVELDLALQKLQTLEDKRQDLTKTNDP